MTVKVALPETIKIWKKAILSIIKKAKALDFLLCSK